MKHAVLVLALLLALPATAQARAFRSPSGNIGCQISAAHTRCDIRDKSWSVPRPKGCPSSSDYGQGLYVTRNGGRGRVVCAGDTALNEGPTLAYGRSVSAGAMTCRSARSGVRCVNRRGHGFKISRGGYKLF